MLERFVSRRRRDWERLESLLDLSRAKRVEALSADEIMELGYLYRRAVADLAVVRRDFPRDRLAFYLNQLVARAHAVVYRSEAGQWRDLIFFFARGFPALFRETLAFTGAAFFIFLLAGAAGFMAVLLAPESASYLVPEQVLDSVKDRRMWTEGALPPSELMASLVMANNIRVALFAFAGGALFGTATFFVLALNGLSLGAVAGICQAYSLSLRLWSFIAPHGFIELTVIFIAGGAGLRVGYALLRPGFYPRREALALAARQVVRLLFGCVPLLVVAGIIEAFVSPSALLPEAKIGIGAGTGVMLYGYLFLSGRRGRLDKG